MPNYEQFSLREVVNHAVESGVSLATSAFFASTCNQLSYNPVETFSFYTAQNNCYYLSHLFFKDAVIELAAAIGHLPLLSMPGKFAVNLFGKEGNSQSIGQQESYNQLVEGSNKIIPIIATECMFPGLGVSMHTEIMSSYARSIAYDIYNSFNPNASYSHSGHFANEYELHTEIEAPIILSLVLLSKPYDNLLNHLLVDEFMIEFFKGLAFETVDQVCPSCSEKFHKFREGLIGQFMQTPQQETY
ncbi:MAG: hypothetical protein RLN62_03185 [Rickettsiales bacterium]